MVLNALIEKYPQLAYLKNDIKRAAETIITAYTTGNKVLICGNGGSCSDADHIVGELMKGFEKKRPVDKKLGESLKNTGSDRGKYLSGKLQMGLPAISLTAHNALITAVANDIDSDLIFAQQVIGYGNPGDVLIGLSTSGNSQNVLDAFIVAKAKGMRVIAITGETGGEMKSLSDILINVPGTRTMSVQEFQLPVYHTLCLLIENYFFPD